MLKQLKRTVLRLARGSGLFRICDRSRWRRNRLLILAYHGISREDEHLWYPGLFMSRVQFGDRMEALRQSGCNVLPLGEGVARLFAGDLPPQAVAITFDDGSCDFYSEAYPILRSHGFPVTVYQTTYYSHFNRPVFDVVCSYILWKARGQSIGGAEFGLDTAACELDTQAKRFGVFRRVHQFVEDRRYTAAEKDKLAARLAELLGVDYDRILQKRILHLLNPEEIAGLAAQGVDIQLHTHRHRMPRDRSLFLSEIEDNRRFLERLTGKRPTHFCYPSGVYHPAFFPWLRESEVASATTCEVGFATPRSNPLLLSRLVDTSLLSEVEFQGWLSGVSDFLPRRAVQREVMA